VKRRVGAAVLLLFVLILAACQRSQVNLHPVAEFTFSPDEEYAPVEVSFDASASADPDGHIIRYDWDFGDGGTGRGMQVTHTYRDDGEYQVRLTVRDDRGAEGTSIATVTVLNPPPVTRFTWRPTEPVVGQTVVFDASASYDPASLSAKEVISWHWEFGDGTQAEGQVVEHVYMVPGTYAVTLTVTDDDGATATSQHPIIVALPSPPCPPVSKDSERCEMDNVE